MDASHCQHRCTVPVGLHYGSVEQMLYFTEQENYGQEIQRLFQDKSANKWQVNRNPVPVISCVAEMLYNPALTQSCQHTASKCPVPPYIQLNKLWGVVSLSEVQAFNF